jgi:hypothetical protein
MISLFDSWKSTPVATQLYTTAAGSWIRTAIIPLLYFRDSQLLTCWLMSLCYCLYSTPSTRFTASVMLALKSLLLSLHYPIHEIYSIRHAGSWISATKSYSVILTGFTASVLLAHDSHLQNLLYPIHMIPSTYQAGSCYWLRTALFTRFSASDMLAHESMLLN